VAGHGQHPPIRKDDEGRIPVAAGLLDVLAGGHIGWPLGDHLAGCVPEVVGRIEQVGVPDPDEVTARVDATPAPVARAAAREHPPVGEQGVAGAEQVDVARQPGDRRDRVGSAVEESGVVDVSAGVQPAVVLVAAEVDDLARPQQRGVHGQDLRRVAAADAIPAALELLDDDRLAQC